ncbi:uncharacterized protein LOC126635158, partial [Myiozetetes cayanensis]|uniref:uncharacterized protein LOC126635158 n=1 Tax=Myiozetetes cayanensis TaxID=478635 RepID=UPI00215EF170
NDSKGPKKGSINLTLCAAVRKNLNVSDVAVENSKGALPAAGEDEKEDNDSPWDSETDSEDAPENVLPPASVSKNLDERSIAVEPSKAILPAAGAGKEENVDPSSENKLPTLEREKLQLRFDSSTQTDSQLDIQPLLTQLLEMLDEVLKTNSPAEASLATMKTHSKDVKEQKVLMQEKLERSETKEPKERHVQNECSPESLKNAPKEKGVRIPRNLQDLPPLQNMPLRAAVRELKERFHRLEVDYARLEATIQCQASIIEIIEKSRQTKKTCNCCTIHGGARLKLP